MLYLMIMFPTNNLGRWVEIHICFKCEGIFFMYQVLLLFLRKIYRLGLLNHNRIIHFKLSRAKETRYA